MENIIITPEEAKRITKTFFLKRHPDKKRWFELAWDVITKNIDTVIDNESNIAFGHALGFAGEPDSEVVEDMVKLMIVFVESFQKVIKKSGEDKIMAVFGEACKKYKINVNLTKEIINYINTKKVAMSEEGKDIYAKMWNLESELEGNPISKKDFNKILKDKKGLELLIVSNGIKEMYIKGKLIEWSLGEVLSDLLIYVLKNQGNGGDVLNLLVNVWHENPHNIKKLRSELKKAKEKHDQVKIGDLKDEKEKITKKVRKMVYDDLNLFFTTHSLNVKLETKGKGQYKLNRRLNYCLIEIL